MTDNLYHFLSPFQLQVNILISWLPLPPNFPLLKLTVEYGLLKLTVSLSKSKHCPVLSCKCRLYLVAKLAF